MHSGGIVPMPPVAATMDLQYRLPPFQQIFFTPTIIVSLALLIVAIAVMVYMSRRAKAKAKVEARREALRMAEKILLKRGGNQDDVNKMMFVFRENPKVDPAAMVMLRDRFKTELRPLLEQTFDTRFGERMELIYFPPSRDSRRVIAAQSKDVEELVHESKTLSGNQTSAAILDLMDATLRPGMIARLSFGKLEGGHECIVMGHDAQIINVTLPANNNQLVASIRPGMPIEGTIECGPSLMAFTSSVIQAVAGSMPYCRITAWKSAWEVRKRDSIRLPISLELDFQHISTAAANAIPVANLDREPGALRPGRLMDISLGGCGIETPSAGVFRIGDMVRFSHSLTTGSPPATLLGAVVKVDALDPAQNEGAKQRLHIQFLVIDDVSQRLLVRTLRQLQDVIERDEWMKAQQLLQKMRRNKIEAIGSPVPITRREDSAVPTSGTGAQGTGAGMEAAKPGTTRVGSKKRERPPTTRSIPKAPPARQPKPSTGSLRRPPPPPPS